MTLGEKLVWAAVYAKAYNLKDVPPWVIKKDLEEGQPGDGTWHDWEMGQVAQAVELAWSAVKNMRDARPRVLDGWGEGDDVLEMLDAMLEEE